MEEKVIKIVGDTSDADKKIANLGKNLKEVDKTAENISEKTAKGVDEIGKSSQKSTKGVGFLTNGFKRLGTAIKLTGIGLVVSLVTALGVAFSKNQRFIDAFNTITETASIILSKVASAFVNVYDSVSSNIENFDALGKVLNGLLTISVTPLKLAFYGIKIAIQQGQLAWEQSFFGGKDKEKIKELTIGILETKNAIFDTGKDAVNAGKDIYNNFSEAITETADIAKKTQEELGKISIKNAYETARANVEIRNTAQLAVAEQGRLVEIFDRQAEKQRQIRDEERNSIAERIEANNNLGKILEEQEKAMLRQASAQIASAQADINKNNTIENQVALIDALANKESVLAQVEGFRSEQLVNDLALKREQIELDQTISDAEKERRLAQLEFEASQELTEQGKLDKQRERLNLENEIILEDLERKRELYKEGTLSRVEAEQEYLTKKQEIDNEITNNERLFSEQRIKDAQVEADAKEEIQNASLDVAQSGVSLLKNLFEKNKGLQKASIVAESAIGIAKIVTNTQAANAAARLKYALIPGGQALSAAEISLNKISAGIGIASNLAATGKALSALGGGSANGGSNQTDSGQQAPSFNLVQGTGSNQIANTISQEQKPIQAYVIGSNVNSQAELDRQRTANSTI